MTNAPGGTLVGTDSRVFDGTIAARILPNKCTTHKRQWQAICQAWRGERDQALLELHRKRLSEHLQNVIAFPEVAS